MLPLLVATGQSPNWSDLGLEVLGVDDDPEVDDHYRVGGRDWLRAIGDLNGRSPWTHSANHEARRLARMLIGEPPGQRTEHMANCVSTSRPVGAVGLTADAAAGRGRDVVADRATGELLGCSGIGARFDDVIGIVAALLHCGCTVGSAAELVVPFPTIGQVLTPAFRDAVDAMG